MRLDWDNTHVEEAHYSMSMWEREPFAITIHRATTWLPSIKVHFLWLFSFLFIHLRDWGPPPSIQTKFFYSKKKKKNNFLSLEIFTLFFLNNYITLRLEITLVVFHPALHTQANNFCGFQLRKTRRRRIFCVWWRQCLPDHQPKEKKTCRTPIFPSIF